MATANWCVFKFKGGWSVIVRDGLTEEEAVSFADVANEKCSEPYVRYFPCMGKL